MKMDHGLKMQVLKHNKIIFIILIFILPFLSFAKTLKVDTLTPSVTDGDLTLTRNGTGDFVLTNFGTGFLKTTAGVLGSTATFDLTADVTGVLPIANGGTNSSTALNNNYVLISSGGAIVESSTIDTTELGYLNGVTSNLQTQLDAKVDEVSSTDNAIVKFDGTSGSVQNTTLVLDDNNNLGNLSVTTFDSVATPSNPSADDYKLYFKSDGNLYKLNSAGTESQVGGDSTPTTTQGDIIVRGASADDRLAIGSVGSFLVVADDGVSLEYSNYLTGTLNPVTEWQSYTCTFEGFGTVTGDSCYYRRVGDSLEVTAKFVTGTPTAVNATIALPSGLTIDTTKSSAAAIVGWGNRSITASTSDNHSVIHAATSDTKVFISIKGSSSYNPFVGELGNTLYGAGEVGSYYFKVPISGWSSGVDAIVSMADLDATEVNAVSAKINIGGTVGSVDYKLADGITDWLESADVTESSGTYTIDISQLGLTVAPACNATPSGNSSSNRTLGRCDATSASSITVTIRDTAGTVQNNDFDLQVIKQGADVNTKQVIAADLEKIGIGGINYIDNPDFEIDTTGWSTFDDASAYVDGTGGTASNLTLSRNITSPIRQTGDLKLVQGAADSRYEGFSYDFTIDKGQQSQMLTGYFWYDTSDANYVDDDIRIFIYDKDNSKIIRVNGEDIKGGKGTHYFQWQAAPDATNYRISFMVNQSNTNGYSVYFDQITVEPTRQALSAIKTAEEEYTPTLSGFATSTTKFFWHRDGEYMVIRGNIKIAGAISGTFKFSLPSGYTADYTDHSVGILGSNAYQQVGTAHGYKTEHVTAKVVRDNTSTTQFRFIGDGATYASGSNVWSNSVPSTWATGDTISLDARIRIAGWQNSGVLHEDLGVGKIIVRGQGNGGTSITANTTNIDFNEVEDTSGSWDGTTFTAPSSGEYIVAGGIYATAAHTGAIAAYIDGTLYKYIGLGTFSGDAKNFSSTIKLEKGENLTIRCSANITLSNSNPIHFIHIQKLESGSQKFETETVAGRWESNDNTTNNVTNNTTQEIIFEDKVFDTHNICDGAGTCTVNVSGVWEIEGCAFFPNLDATSGEFLIGYIYINGVAESRIIHTQQASLSDQRSICTRHIGNLSTGDTFDFRIYQNMGVNEAIDNDGSGNFLQFKRIK